MKSPSTRREAETTSSDRRVNGGSRCASRFLEHAGVPFFGQVVVVRSRSLIDIVVNTAGMGFS